MKKDLLGLTNEISRGNFRKALTHGEAALISDEVANNPSLRASVLRNMRAAHDHLGETDGALAKIQEAYDVHDGLARKPGADPEALYERSVTGSYVGIYALKAALLSEANTEQNKTYALEMAHQAQDDMAKYKEVKGLTEEPQYEINMLGRWSMIESLAGDKSRGLILAGRAIWAARLSEKVTGPEKEMTKKDILRARVRAAVRGVGAVAVNVCSRTQPTHKMAEKLALKFL